MSNKIDEQFGKIRRESTLDEGNNNDITYVHGINELNDNRKALYINNHDKS